MLQRRGVLTDAQLQSIREDVALISSDDNVTVNRLVGSSRPVLHFVVAAILFRPIAGVTPDTFL